MRYVHFDKKTNEILGFYDDEIHGENIPEPNFTISDEAWQKALSEGASAVNAKTKTLIRIEKGLEEIKVDKIREIEKARDDFQYSPIKYKDAEFQADLVSQSLITKAFTYFVAVGATPKGFAWLDSENIPRPFSLEDVKALAGLIISRTNEAANKSWALKEQIRNAKSAAALEEIKWK